MISIVIPAHNEAAVIARTLQSMTAGAADAELDVIVVCNGCTDDTALVARRFYPTVRVVETEVAGKPHALNLGDAAALAYPRVYVDADVVVTLQAIRALARRLEAGDVLAVAPQAEFDVTGCSWPVRAFYAIRALLPSAKEGIGGSGVYALSQAGRTRFGEFPAVIADDGFVRIQFQPQERETLTSARSKVFPPRTIHDLVATKTRSHFGSFQLARLYPSQWSHRGESNDKRLLNLFADPRLWVNLIVYCLVTISARRRAAKRMEDGAMRWERDNTSRRAA